MKKNLIELSSDDDAPSPDIKNVPTAAKWPAVTDLVYPPNGGYIGLKEQTEEIQSVIQAAITSFLSTILFRTGFPTGEETTLGIRKALYKCARTLNEIDIAARLQVDAKYSKHMGQSVRLILQWHHFVYDILYHRSRFALEAFVQIFAILRRTR